MRVVSWNVRGASKKKKEVWDFLLALQPDVALLQEVGDIPAQVSDEFDCLIRPAVTEDGRNQEISYRRLNPRGNYRERLYIGQ